MRRKPFFAWSICLPVMMAILAFPMGASAQTGSLLTCFPHPTTGGCAAGNGRGVAFDGIDLYYTFAGGSDIYKTDVNGNCLGACSTAGLSAGGPLAYDFGNNTVWTIDYSSNSFTIYEFTWQAGGNCPLVSSCDMSLVNPAHPAITTVGPGNIGDNPDGMHWTAADTLWISEETVGGNVTVEVDISLGSCNIVNGYINPLTLGIGTSGLAFDGVDVWHAANGSSQIYQTQVPPTPPPNTLAPTPAKGPNIFPDTAGCEDLEWDTNTFANQNVCGLWCNTVSGGVPQPASLCAFEVPCAEVCDPDPRTQGYWHRQCLGAGRITPGRNSEGRGPQEPNDPDFFNIEPAVDLALFNTVGEPLACADGMEADPPSDTCEKAKKHLTALLFNIESGRVQNLCEVDLAAEGCTSTTIADLVVELGDKIMNGDCLVAAACAAAVNEGEGDLGGSPALTSVAVSGTDSGSATTFGAGSRSVVREAVTVDSPVEPVVVETTPLFLAGTPYTEAPAAVADSPVEPEADADPAETIEDHLAVFSDAASSESARSESSDALLTALSGGYEPELRLEIAKALMGRLDVAYHDLLAGHLEDIRAEAEDFGKTDLAKEATRLLERLEK